MSDQPPVAPSGAVDGHDVRIEVADSPEDFAGLFECAAAAFGHQINDAIWTGMNPGWDTPEGQARGAAAMEQAWRTTTRNNQGDANTVYVKATVPDENDKSRRRVAGVAIWIQTSVVEGHGQLPKDDAILRQEIDAMYPENEPEARFLFQMMQSLRRRRFEIAREKATADPPAIMALNTCAVHPAFQRRGIALKLVQWGLDEAKRRGGLEATTEASAMGRFVYTRLGFHPEGDGADMIYDIDSEFAGRRVPSNLFLRTGAS